MAALIRALPAALVLPRLLPRVAVLPARSLRACCKRDISASIAAINSDVFIGGLVYVNFGNRAVSVDVFEAPTTESNPELSNCVDVSLKVYLAHSGFYSQYETVRLKS
jgi:hypothetical protein